MENKELKDMAEIAGQVVETLEYTDEDGVAHCFIVENKFPVGKETFAALLEVDPSIFDEEKQEECCEQHTEHAEGHLHHEGCCCGRHHETKEITAEDSEEEANIILAKIIEDENGEIDIQVPTDEEFEKARLAYEALDEE